MEPTTKYQTPPQVAERLGVNPVKVLGWIRDGELRAVDVSLRPGKGRPRWRIAPDALRDFERSRSCVASAAPAPSRRRREKDHQYV
jgi:hypothetical protein